LIRSNQFVIIRLHHPGTQGATSRVRRPNSFVWRPGRPADSIAPGGFQNVVKNIVLCFSSTGLTGKFKATHNLDGAKAFRSGSA
jgi:hypothetical protein